MRQLSNPEVAQALLRAFPQDDLDEHRADFRHRWNNKTGCLRRFAWAMGVRAGHRPFHMTGAIYGLDDVHSATWRLCRGLIATGGDPIRFADRGACQNLRYEHQDKAKLLAFIQEGTGWCDVHRLDVHVETLTVWLASGHARTYRYDTSELGDFDPHTCYLPPGGHPDDDL